MCVRRPDPAAAGREPRTGTARNVSVTTQSRALDWAHHEIVTSRTARRIIGVAAFAVATAFGARLAVPIPGTPVPFTLQVMFVLLAGAALGPRLGAASQAAYLAAGALGAPIFAAGGGLLYLLGPTGGYLLAFPLAAFAVGAIAGRDGGALRLLAGLVAGVMVIHAGGVAWLSVMTDSPTRALALGVGPFLALDVVKIALVLLVSLRIRNRTLELF
ncbi:MAG: biotin transporter BioY [Gemmatimonadetes bacterium]|uniref:Biotin transporter n=1 Tax=Candidatus Kutchimonas denitrificans TaxID=3056748 RepID=A0AAE4ZBX8_9BACT|nr:biotin transporter BioY [Gemmatimonadota bacterium]NIR76582.1 biotin transporter BioY [Candidatus Kutchimonas denitrificans]NIS01138.1 biotin transporter BioY [Gemmatimonadota bacterium]NIT66905.1 biotin transporter BioY [Gemmatimonadota bacterium]NIU54678.1 biotin transporter BioY [Gemmatimonadota bacterium]